MSALRKIVGEGEELTVPASLREAMGVKPGDTVLVEVHGQELRIRSELSALRRVQQRLRKHVVDGHLVSDELIAERRAEAARE